MMSKSLAVSTQGSVHVWYDVTISVLVWCDNAEQRSFMYSINCMMIDWSYPSSLENPNFTCLQLSNAFFITLLSLYVSEHGDINRRTERLRCVYAPVNSSCAHPPPPGNCGAFARIVSPGGRALAYPRATPGLLTHVVSDSKSKRRRFYRKRPVVCHWLACLSRTGPNCGGF